VLPAEHRLKLFQRVAQTNFTEVRFMRCAKTPLDARSRSIRNTSSVSLHQFGAGNRRSYHSGQVFLLWQFPKVCAKARPDLRSICAKCRLSKPGVGKVTVAQANTRCLPHRGTVVDDNTNFISVVAQDKVRENATSSDRLYCCPTKRACMPDTMSTMPT